MSDTYGIHRALFEASVRDLKAAIEDGADVNGFDASRIHRCLSAAMEIGDTKVRHAALRMLLDAGADPNLLDDKTESLGPLFSAVLAQDPVALEMLLGSGADPNRELSTGRESLYDYAEFHYRYHLGWVETLPEEPDDSDRCSQESWLRFLERLAMKYGKSPPDHLFLLRRFGARSFDEFLPGQVSDG